MNPIFRTILPLFLSAALFGAGCSDDALMEVDPTQPAPEPGTLSEVTIGCRSGIDAEVRTSLGDRDETAVEVRWSADDTFLLAARETESGKWVTENARFALQFFSSEWYRATFAGLVDLSKYDAAKRYDYFASAPAGASTLAADGTATFTLPAIQNGEFSGAYDWMTASLKGARALEGNPHIDDPANPYPQLNFTHRIHVLEITLADVLMTDKSNITEPIKAIELTFPTAVAGRLSIAADADASTLPAIAEGSQTIRLEFATPKTKGDKVYAFIAPVQLAADAKVAIQAFGTKEHESRQLTFAKSAGLFRSGRVSPIAYRVPQRRIVTKVEFSLGDALGKETLGEEVTQFQIVEVDASGNPTGSPIHKFAVNATNKYVVEYEGTFDNRYNGKQYKVQYCSPSTNEWALTSKESFTIDVVAEEYNKIRELQVPYLFEEDFSNVKGFNNHDNAGGGTTVDKYEDAIALDQYGLPGWSGTRCGAEAGNAFRICVRTEDGMFTVARYHGRLDTPPLSCLKKTVRVTVSFNYSIDISWNEHQPRIAYGYHTTQGLISSQKGNDTNLTNPVSKDITGSGGSYSSIKESATYTIEQCTNQHRLAWDIYSSERKTGNSNGWLYLDNIKVSIK